ncbi:MAG: T9SS type A sorting domain-containing protein [Bacteroidota bacterium]
MKTSYLLLVLLVSAKAMSQCAVYGPNLIPNPSFELTTAFCTGTDNQLYVDQSPVQNWIGTDPLSSGGSTPDITRNDATVCGSSVNAANNTCFTGTKKMGLFVYVGSNSREYVQTALVSNLIAGRTYCFSMDVRSRYGAAGNVLLNTDGIGAHFRNSGAINIQTMNGGNQFLGPGSTINATPQVQQPAGVVITNTCTVVTGTFVAAGGESRVVIGNFRNNAATTTVGAGSAGYMYIDNLTLYEVNPLPVELLDFNANCADEKVLLTWATESERDNDFFTIEKSCDGFGFEKVATIPGAGNSSVTQHYTLTDPQPCHGTSYYRLSQTDYNGNMEVFDLVTVSCGNATEALLYPNPASTSFSLMGNLNAKDQLQLFSSNGELVRDFSEQLSDTKSLLTVDIRGISSGVYLLRLAGQGSNPVIYKLVIQE